MYSDTFKPSTTTILGSEYEIICEGHHILKDRRVELELTQQQVAERARIQLRQYQRLESGERSMYGASLRIALSICDVLKLDPFRFVPEIKRQPSE